MVQFNRPRITFYDGLAVVTVLLLQTVSDEIFNVE